MSNYYTHHVHAPVKIGDMVQYFPDAEELEARSAENMRTSPDGIPSLVVAVGIWSNPETRVIEPFAIICDAIGTSSTISRFEDVKVVDRWIWPRNLPPEVLGIIPPEKLAELDALFRFGTAKSERMLIELRDEVLAGVV